MKREWLVLGFYQEPILTLSNKKESLWNAMIGRSIYSPPYRFVKETPEELRKAKANLGKKSKKQNNSSRYTTPGPNSENDSKSKTLPGPALLLTLSPVEGRFDPATSRDQLVRTRALGSF